MITAPDVFATDSDGTYTSDVAVDWVAHHGTPSPLYIGRTLRHIPGTGWEFGPTAADTKQEWKPLAEAPKTLRAAFGDPDDVPTMAEGWDPDRAAYYELIGPKLAKNPHGLERPHIIRHGLLREEEAADFQNVATTSLWALARNWFPEHNHQGVLWTWDDGNSDFPQFAAVRRDRLPRLED